jgi:hypothetical protein
VTDDLITGAQIVTIGERGGVRYTKRLPVAAAPGLTLAEAVHAAAGRYEALSDTALATFHAAADTERIRRGLPAPFTCVICGVGLDSPSLPAGTRTCSERCDAEFERRAS